MIVTADDHKPFHDVLAATTLHHLIPPSSPGSCKLITIRTIEIIFIWNNFLSLMPSLSPVSGVSPPWSHGPVSVPRSWCWYWPGYVSQSHHCIKHYHLIIPVNCSLNQLNIDKWKVCHWLIVSHRSVQCCCGPGHMYHGHQYAPVYQVSMHNDVMSESRDDDCIMTWNYASRPMRTMIILLMTTHYNYYNYYMHITPLSSSPQYYHIKMLSLSSLVIGCLR